MKEITQFDKDCLEKALGVAREVYVAGRFPVGAVLAIDNEIVAMGGNEYSKHVPEQKSYVNHAENLLIIKNGVLLANAYKQGKNISLYSTLEPCIQCLGASVTTILIVFFILNLTQTVVLAT